MRSSNTHKTEIVAEEIHKIWTAWAQELLKSEKHISSARKERWKTECFMPYQELSEEMKELDRKFANRILKTIEL